MARKTLITDGLLVAEDVQNLKHICKPNCMIEDVKDIVNCESPNSRDVFFVSVGSLNVTAKGCGWDHVITRGTDDLLEDACSAFRKCLNDLNSIRKKKRCVIRLVGLLPFPDEQNLDQACPERKELCEMLSKLFCFCNSEIKRFNGAGGTVNLEKFVSISGSRKYSTGQLKIKCRAFKEGLPTVETKANICRRIVEHLNKL